MELGTALGCMFLANQCLNGTELGLNTVGLVKSSIIGGLTSFFGYEPGMSMGLFLSKIAGTLVMVGAAVMRLPQIARIQREKSVTGLSPQMYYQDVSTPNSKPRTA